MTPRTSPLGTIANRLLARREELAEEMRERIRAGVAEFAGFDGPELWEAVRVSCLANLEAGLAAMAHDLALPEAIPADARDLALLTARLDLPLAALLRSYRVGHQMTWTEPVCSNPTSRARVSVESREESGRCGAVGSRAR